MHSTELFNDEYDLALEKSEYWARMYEIAANLDSICLKSNIPLYLDPLQQ